MRDVDLNLIAVFDAIMTERSVTKAAERLAMTQPAVSNAVSRMRHAWDDPLFVKNGRGIQPTPKAFTLWTQVREPLHNLREAVSPPEFVPRHAARRFRIAVSDVTVQLVWPPLRQLIEAEAPGIDIHAVPYMIQGAERQLMDADVDMSVGAFEDVSSEIRTQWLFESQYICAMRKDHPLAGKALTMERFLAADHLLVSLSGDPIGIVDELLAAQGLKRRVAMTVNQFWSVPSLLGQTNLLCMVSRSVIGCSEIASQLHFTAPPLNIPPKRISLAWHARHDRDPGHAWMREQLSTVAVQRWASHGRCPWETAKTGEKRKKKGAEAG